LVFSADKEDSQLFFSFFLAGYWEAGWYWGCSWAITTGTKMLWIRTDCCTVCWRVGCATCCWGHKGTSSVKCNCWLGFIEWGTLTQNTLLSSTLQRWFWRESLGATIPRLPTPSTKLVGVLIL
jgi:hypothetical protein